MMRAVLLLLLVSACAAPRDPRLTNLERQLWPQQAKE
jgi:hypothetical protein